LTADHWPAEKREQVLSGLSGQAGMASTQVEHWLDGLAA